MECPKHRAQPALPVDSILCTLQYNFLLDPAVVVGAPLSSACVEIRKIWMRICGCESHNNPAAEHVVSGFSGRSDETVKSSVPSDATRHPLYYCSAAAAGSRHTQMLNSHHCLYFLHVSFDSVRRTFLTHLRTGLLKAFFPAWKRETPCLQVDFAGHSLSLCTLSTTVGYNRDEGAVYAMSS